MTQQKPRGLVVTRREVVAEQVVALTLESTGEALPTWEPGAHIDLVLPSGLIRQYSLCGDPADRTEYRIAVLREPAGRGGSVEVHEALSVGSLVGFLGPRNKFALVPAPGHLFLAGGIGITPLMTMIRELGASGGPWRLVYGGRSRSTMAFVAELGEFGSGEVVVVPQDEVGVPDLEGYVRDLPAGHQIYCCGPGGMIDAVRDLCARNGADSALHVERFVVMPNDAAMTSGSGTDRPIEVTLATSGHTLHVPADRSILEVVREVVSDVLFSCGEGDCGTCETTVIDGVPDHRDLVLSDAERDAGETMMICVSRAKSEHLILDL